MSAQDRSDRLDFELVLAGAQALHQLSEHEGPGTPTAARTARTVVDAVAPRLIAEGRRQAAAAIRDHARRLVPDDGHLTGPRAALRRHLLIAARIAAGLPSAEQLAALAADLDAAVRAARIAEGEPC